MGRPPIHDETAMNALSIDLRQRILNYSLTHSIKQTVDVFQVSRGTVRRLKNLYYQTGGVAPMPVKADHWKAISSEGELYLKAYVLEHPDLTLGQLCEHYGLVYGVTPGVATMHNALKRIGITRKKRHSTIRASIATRTRRKKTITSMS